MAKNNSFLLLALAAGAGYYFYKKSQSGQGLTTSRRGSVIVPPPGVLTAEQYQELKPDDTLPAGTDFVLQPTQGIEKAVAAAVSIAKGIKDFRAYIPTGGNKKLTVSTGAKKSKAKKPKKLTKKAAKKIVKAATSAANSFAL